ncbi:MAG: DUF559 domain-containing protein [Candidatus Sungiibacteriota bacterium]
MSIARIGKEPANKTYIDRQQLFGLYVLKTKTASEVAAILDISPSVIKNRIQLYGWSRTTKESCNLPAFREKMRQLRIQRLSSARLLSPNRLEQQVYSELDRRSIFYLKQHPLYNKFVVDAFIPDRNIVIEIFGKYWHERPEIHKKDVSKKAYLEKCGHAVKEIWDYEVKENLTGAVNRVLSP